MRLKLFYCLACIFFYCSCEDGDEPLISWRVEDTSKRLRVKIGTLPDQQYYADRYIALYGTKSDMLRDKNKIFEAYLDYSMYSEVDVPNITLDSIYFRLTAEDRFTSEIKYRCINPIIIQKPNGITYHTVDNENLIRTK